MMSKQLHLPLALAMTLAACGGGGGGGASSPFANIQFASTPTPLVIDSGAVAKDAFSDAYGFVSTINSFGNQTFLALGVHATGLSALFALAGQQFNQLDQYMADARQTQLAGGVFGVATTTYMCGAGGGNYVGTVTDSNGNGDFDTGDSVAITFNNCDFGTGDKVNGSLKIIINAKSGPFSGVYGAEVTFGFNDLSLSNGLDTNALSGNLYGNLRKTAVIIAGSTIPGVYDRVNNFTTDATGIVANIAGDNVYRRIKLTNLDMDTNRTYTSSTSYYDSFKPSSGTITRTDGKVTDEFSLVTSTNFKINMGAAFPSEGGMLLTGAYVTGSASTKQAAWVAVTSATPVKIEVGVQPLSASGKVFDDDSGMLIPGTVDNTKTLSAVNWTDF